MRQKQSLSAPDRDFFRIVSQAAFTNPFSQSRMEIDRRLADAYPSIPWDDAVEQAVARISERLRTLRVRGFDDLTGYGDDDRELLRTALLFELYHQYRQPFDAFILKQLAAGDTPIPLPFATTILSALSNIGLNHAAAHRFLAIFYQIRRAFYFIESGLTGLSPAMRNLRLQLWNNIFTCNITWYEQHLWDRMEDFSTLLLGETGAGKGAAAAAIGRSGFIPFDERKGCFSESFTRSFIAINLSQYPESLLDSELFGHKKGAITGAIENHEGVFDRCSPHGSIFLDEIGDVSIPVQIKLLQVLQERTFAAVGSHERRRFQGRVIAATNRPLDEMRASGQFRNDFYYRLCSDIVTVPSLRERITEEPRELEALAARILRRMVGEKAVEYARLVCDAIRRDVGADYAWPGNVRELEQAIRRIIITRHYKGDNALQNQGGRDNELLEAFKNGSLDAESLLAGYCTALYRRHGSYEEVARITNLDRRTAKKYIRKD
jgi:transcriptional regulator with AAA-type ATPase domain